jgi:hypothetical protein
VTLIVSATFFETYSVTLTICVVVTGLHTVTLIVSAPGSAYSTEASLVHTACDGVTHLRMLPDSGWRVAQFALSILSPDVTVFRHDSFGLVRSAQHWSTRSRFPLW